jgi:formate dehydrogenase major subunit
MDDTDLKLTRWSTAEADENTMFTGTKNIFAGGDFRRGPATAVEAIADGAKAAEYIEKFLNKDPLIFDKPKFNSQKEKKLSLVATEHYKQFKKANRINVEYKDAKQSFEEVEPTYSAAQAIEEAKRCLECSCEVEDKCNLRKYASQYDININKYKGKKNKHFIDISHTTIKRDENKCIKCNKCVRICEIHGLAVLGSIGRGFEMKVSPEYGESLNKTKCDACDKCIDICPTGAFVRIRD